MSEQREVDHYTLKVWSKGVVKREETFPGTSDGKRRAERLKASIKSKKPGRKGQAVTITPIFKEV